MGLFEVRSLKSEVPVWVGLGARNRTPFGRTTTPDLRAGDDTDVDYPTARLREQGQAGSNWLAEAASTQVSGHPGRAAWAQASCAGPAESYRLDDKSERPVIVLSRLGRAGVQTVL